MLSSAKLTRTLLSLGGEECVFHKSWGGGGVVARAPISPNKLPGAIHGSESVETLCSTADRQADDKDRQQINCQHGQQFMYIMFTARRLLLWSHMSLHSIKAVYIPGKQNHAEALLTASGSRVPRIQTI